LLSRTEYQQFLLWKSVDIVLFNWFVSISFYFLIHIIIGGVIFFISFYQCIAIVKINNQVHQTKNQPKELLDSGYYSKVRHPMTSRFILIILAFFFMLSSLIVIPFIILFSLFFLFLTKYEEKKILYPIFEEKYREYIKKVKNRFFTIRLKILILILSIFMMFGVIFI
jgi:protein-S-isoprenylcysteine O-methyltransferase Ste14